MPLKSMAGQAFYLFFDMLFVTFWAFPGFPVMALAAKLTFRFNQARGLAGMTAYACHAKAGMFRMGLFPGETF